MKVEFGREEPTYGPLLPDKKPVAPAGRKPPKIGLRVKTILAQLPLADPDGNHKI